MKKAYRVKSEKDFQKILHCGKSFANRELVIYFLEKPAQDHFRIGISVGKKLGNAVMRNKIKRYIREAFLQIEATITPEVDIIIIARNPTINLNVEQIKKSLNHLLSRQKLLIRNNGK